MAGRYIRKGPARQRYETGVGRVLLRTQLDVFAAQCVRQIAADRDVSVATILSECVHQYLEREFATRLQPMEQDDD